MSNDSYKIQVTYSLNNFYHPNNKSFLFIFTFNRIISDTINHLLQFLLSIKIASQSAKKRKKDAASSFISSKTIRNYEVRQFIASRRTFLSFSVFFPLRQWEKFLIFHRPFPQLLTRRSKKSDLKSKVMNVNCDSQLQITVVNAKKLAV